LFELFFGGFSPQKKRVAIAWPKGKRPKWRLFYFVVQIRVKPKINI